MNLHLAWPWMLLVSPLPLLAYWLPPAATRALPTLRFPYPGLVAAGAFEGAKRTVRWRVVLAALAWLLLVSAAARPQMLGPSVQIAVSGRSLMLAVDLSGSMQTPDMELQGRAVSRLLAVKAVAGDFIDRRVGDRVGLILFGDQAYLQAPLTLDRSTVHTLLNEAQIGLAGQQTAIGDAIGLAIKRLRAEPAENRVLILLTDGASNAGSVDPMKAADLAAADGVRIYTIGVGSGERTVRGPFGFSQTVVSDLDEGALQAIAQKTGGRYFRAADGAALAQIYAELDHIEPRSRDTRFWRPVAERYGWPLAAAFLLALVVALGAPGLLPRRHASASVSPAAASGVRHV